MLENKMIDIDKTDSEGLNAFWIAGRCGHGGIMQVLAEKGINIMNTDKEGNNVLHTAARNPDRYNVLEMLIKSRFPLDLPNEQGDTALHIAAQRGNLPHIKALVKQGANYDLLNKASLSPLYLAVLNGKDSEYECAEYLLEQGAQSFIDGTDEEKDRSPIFLAIRQDQPTLLEIMYDYSEPDINPKNSQGLTPLMYAAKHNKTYIVNFLTQRKIDLNEEDKNGMTILVLCLNKGGKDDIKMARKLVARGADVNWIDKNGNTPLLTFVQLKKPDQVRFLLEKKANQHICDEENKDACDYAKANGLAGEQGFEQFMSCSIHLKNEAKRMLKL